ncbi:MAG: AMIN domain-containing protein [Alphaproteobacteria bacterium]|nr:AMIN domain-containing protein [Alphaproteobacteria bacterium]
MTLRRRFAVMSQTLTSVVVALTFTHRNLFAAHTFWQLAMERGSAFALDHATYGKGALLTRRQLRSLPTGFVRLSEPVKGRGASWIRSVARAVAAAFCALVLSGAAFADPPTPRPKPIDILIAATRIAVTDARIGQNGNHTRFVLNLSEKVDFEVFTLADPYRIVIDLPEVAWRLTGDGQAAAGGAIRGYRYGLFRPGRSRMVIDLSGPMAIANKFLLPPEGERRYRLVLDLAPVNRSKYLATAGWPKDEQSQPESEPDVAIDDGSRPANARRVVVIDPGHGGVDPGTTGYSGTYEKDVVLALGKQLRDALVRTGRYDVVMTRDTDIFLSLRARVAVARRAGADLFISLHADSSPNSSSVRGASVYTLSERASDREADALARAENQSDIIAGVDLTNEPDIVTSILIDLAQRETKNNSARFAQILLPELGRSGRIVARTHRFAGFVVLKAPDVPSVLIETGYLSNKQDEAALNNNRWRSEMAKGIARGVDRYFALIRHGKTARGTE